AVPAVAVMEAIPDTIYSEPAFDESETPAPIPDPSNGSAPQVQRRRSIVPREEPIHVSEKPDLLPLRSRAPRTTPSRRGQQQGHTSPPVEPRTVTAAAEMPAPTVTTTTAADERIEPAVDVVTNTPFIPPVEIEKSEPIESPVMETSERPALILNGQEVDVSPLVKQRKSIVPRNNEENERPLPAVMSPPSRIKKRHAVGRDDDPNKRYFRVEDFTERKKVRKRDDILPPLELLDSYDLHKPDEEEINRNASIIENTLLEFDIDADVIDVKVGPVVTQYAVSPIKEVLNPETGEIEINRVRVDRITNLQGDLALALAAKRLRIEAPVPGHSYVGIEVPNSNPSTVGLRPVLESETYYHQAKSPLSIPLGRDVSGEAMVIDLASLPHLLVAGTTGSGKSVFLTSVVNALVLNNTPELVKLIMLDPKRVELTRFNGLPHLLGPVETEADRIIGVLRWTTREMDRRYKLMELENARNIDSYNASLGRRRRDEHLPYMVLLFDEIGDLMMSHPDETEGTVTRLAQKARAAGIHMIIATQRPSVDVLTGVIKANFPGRLSFAVASGTDSRVILDYVGAETLLGRGDLLYLAPDASGPRRVQGCFVSDREVEEIVMYWTGWHEEQIAEGSMERLRVAPWERGLTRLEALSEQDPMLEEAIQLVVESNEASTSLIQRRLGIGYPRAARLMDSLFELGIIGPPKTGGRARTVNVKTYN
ncbi:MAG TPA: DNA translocase FtsK, partial [Aggregatilineales bacterium]|nr:DNA translocase FtsK [Aggregatilineales bacterium]